MKKTGFKRKKGAVSKRLKEAGCKPVATIAKHGGSNPPRSTKKPTYASLKKQADRVYSEYIRLSDADEFGNVRCFTCGKVMHWKQAQNGHYIPRHHLSTRWLGVNCHPQCVHCNIFLRGNMHQYALALTRKYGNEILELLGKEKNKIKKFSREELESIINQYQRKGE